MKQPDSECTRIKLSLWDVAYGLLSEHEPEEASLLSNVKSHVNSCPSCRVELERIRGQKTKLGTAAKVSTTIVFQAPQVEPVRQSSTLKAEKSSTWSKWILAASLLFSILLATGTAYTRNQYAQEVASLSTEISRKTKPLRSLEDQFKHSQSEALKLGEQEAHRVAELNRKMSEFRNSIKAKVCTLEAILPATLTTNQPHNILVQEKPLSGADVKTTIVRVTPNKESMMDAKKATSGLVA